MHRLGAYLRGGKPIVAPLGMMRALRSTVTKLSLIGHGQDDGDSLAVVVGDVMGGVESWCVYGVRNSRGLAQYVVQAERSGFIHRYRLEL